jgi:surface protein
MSKRSNSGYIGPVFRDDMQGIINQDKNYQIRFLSQNDQYSSITNLMGQPPIPDNALLYLPIIATNGGGSGSVASVSSLVSGSLATLTLYNAGSGYGTAATLSFSGGGGTGADGYAATYTAGALTTVERLGYIPSVIITNPGSGYVTTPTASFSAPTTANNRVGVTATASVTMSGGIITAINIVNTGSGYRGGSNYPTITINGGTPTISASVVPVVEFGRGYTSTPTVTVSGPGTGAVVSASIYAYLPTSARLTDSGSGYTTNPDVQIVGAAYTGAPDSTYARASLSGNQVSGVQIITGSSTFNAPPTVNISGLPILPAVSNNQIIGTYAVYNNMSNYVAIRISGSFTVNWGDGVIENYSANAASVTASHAYTTASYAAITASVYNGYKPVVINIVPSGSGVTFKTVSFTVAPSTPTGSYVYASAGVTNNWVDIKMAGSDISSLSLGGQTTGTTPCRNLERFEFSGSNKITDFTSVFQNCYNLKQIVSLDTSLGTNFASAFASCYNLVSLPSLNFSSNNVSNGYTGIFTNCYNLESVTLNLSQIIPTQTTNMFASCYNLRSVNANFGSNITNHRSMFSNCFNLIELPSINTSNSTDLSSMFNGCNNLKSVKLIGNTRNNTTCANMFTSCYSLTDLPQTLDLRSCTTLSSMFSGCYSLIKAPIFTNTYNVTTCLNMFSGCYSLKYIPLFDTQNVTTMNGMFNSCYSLISVPLFNTGKVTDMSAMLSSCFSLKTIPQFNTANVTTMASMFLNCANLTTIPQLNTPKLNVMTSMLQACTNLQTVPLFDTSNVTSFASVFSGCSSLKEIPLFETANVTSFSGTFSGCNVLRSFPLFNTSNCTVFTNMFQNCNSLADVAPIDTSLGTNFSSMFNGCSSLKTIPLLNTSRGTVAISMFQGCSNLQEVPALNFSSVSSNINSGTIFNSIYSIKRNQMTGLQYSVDISNQQLDSTALNEIYTNLGTAAVSGSTTITVTGNWGTPNDSPAIATAKNWAVTG